MNTLMISKDIYSALTADSSLAEYIGARVYPIVAEEGTTYPFLVYKRESMYCNSCKCGIYEDVVGFSVTTLTTEYLQGLEIADRVRNDIQKGLTCSLENHSYRNVKLTGASEEFSNEGWIQTLNFEVIVEGQDLLPPPPPTPTMCDLWLVDPGSAKLLTVKAVKEVYGLGLADAKNLVDGAPTLMPHGENITITEANIMIQAIHDHNDNDAIFELRNQH